MSGLFPEHCWLPGEASLPARVRPRGLETRGAGGGEGRGGDTVRGHQLHGQRAPHQGRRVPRGKVRLQTNSICVRINLNRAILVCEQTLF